MKFLTQLQSVLLCIGVAACASSGTPESAPPPPAAPAAEAPAAPVMAAIAFTEVQANRGRDTFRAGCTECHYSSEFADAQFKFKWSQRSVGRLFQLIQTSMPESAPGSLSSDETVQLVAYVLRMNGFEAGPDELPTDPAILDGMSLESMRGEAQHQDD
jgi:S-disulfanyl-L-cysteine oxidoreductase SoxD